MRDRSTDLIPNNKGNALIIQQLFTYQAKNNAQNFHLLPLATA